MFRAIYACLYLALASCHAVKAGCPVEWFEVALHLGLAGVIWVHFAARTRRRRSA